MTFTLKSETTRKQIYRSRTSFCEYAADAGTLANHSLRIRGGYGTLSKQVLWIRGRRGNALDKLSVNTRWIRDSLETTFVDMRPMQEFSRTSLRGYAVDTRLSRIEKTIIARTSALIWRLFFGGSSASRRIQCENFLRSKTMRENMRRMRGRPADRTRTSRKTSQRYACARVYNMKNLGKVFNEERERWFYFRTQN